MWDLSNSPIKKRLLKSVDYMSRGMFHNIKIYWNRKAQTGLGMFTSKSLCKSDTYNKIFTGLNCSESDENMYYNIS